MAKAVCLLIALIAWPALAGENLLKREEWAQPRDGKALVQIPVLRESVAQLLATPGSSLHLIYPGGEEGSLWASELRAWLIALGVAPGRIRLWPGSAHADAILLRVERSE